ncbi:MAG: homocysteine S-methyltransferase family protein, partial [Pseudomonadales bacterium]
MNRPQVGPEVSSNDSSLGFDNIATRIKKRSPVTNKTTVQSLKEHLSQQILVMDGAMGTAIQTLGLTEADFRGDRFLDHEIDLKGNNELLTLTRPDIIEKIHFDYLTAGAD